MTATLFDHPWKNFLDEEKGRFKIGIQDGLPVRILTLGDQGVACDADAVNDHIQLGCLFPQPFVKAGNLLASCGIELKGGFMRGTIPESRGKDAATLFQEKIGNGPAEYARGT